MNWYVGEIAEMVWDMTKEGLPKLATKQSVRVVAVGSKRVTVVASPETERAGALGDGLKTIMELMPGIEWHFDPKTGKQLPETKFVYNATLHKLNQTKS